MPRARLNTPDGRTTEWKSTAPAGSISSARLLPTRYAGCAARRLPVWWCGRQGYGEPGLAQGEDRLGRVERPLACRRTDRAAHSRRHGESTEAWRTVLDDLIKRGLRRSEFLIVDGAPGLDKAIAVVWGGVPVQRCTVHKHRNLLAHAPERLHEEITADYTDMIYAAAREEN